METVKCNLCGSDNYRFIYSMPDARYFVDEWFSVVECVNCGLGFVNPRPTSSEMSRYYPSSFYDYFNDQRSYHLHRYATEAKYLQGVVTDSDKLLLDIGCANGDFPRFMQQQGWKVEGIEVSMNSEPIYDFKVYKKEFKDIPIHEPLYDAITAWAVLEHVHDPMAYFKKAAQVLKPNGLFVFLVTNYESLSSRCLFLEDVPRHLYFYTEETIKKYLNKSGLELTRKDCCNQIYAMHPANYLRYFFYHYIKRRKFEWKDALIARQHFPESKGLKNLIKGRLKYLIANPLYLIERVLMPLYEKYQMITNTYGIVTYVARRG
jgi:SAM-dependent methyltransferase